MSKCIDKPLKLLPRSGPTLMLWRMREESRKRDSERREPIRFKLRLLPVTRRTLKSIGLGKSLRRRKIARNWQK